MLLHLRSIGMKILVHPVCKRPLINCVPACVHSQVEPGGIVRDTTSTHPAKVFRIHPSGNALVRYLVVVVDYSFDSYCLRPLENGNVSARRDSPDILSSDIRSPRYAGDRA